MNLNQAVQADEIVFGSEFQVGLPGVRVDRSKVEPAGDQEEANFDGRYAREPARAALGGLEETVEGFEEAVPSGQTRPHVALAHCQCRDMASSVKGAPRRPSPELEPACIPGLEVARVHALEHQ